ncbi:MAG: hypothetical protein KGZ74_18535 [Chitinophagaceae bacterium]|nr:hypothetical protein [Chitinophagaceae bacterium]
MKIISAKNQFSKGLQSLTIILILTHNHCLAQTFGTKQRSMNVKVQASNPTWYNKRFWSVFGGVSILPSAKIIVLEGIYNIEPKPNLAFTGGFSYTRNYRPDFSFNTGLEATITKINFYKRIPQSEIPSIPRDNDAPPIIYYKEVHAHISIPICIIRRFKLSESDFWAIKAGCNINYNGFNLDTGIGMSAEDVNGQQVGIFSGDFNYTNSYKPWVSFTTAFSKNLVLSNKNILGIEASFEAGKNGYVRGDYVITIPNKPNSYGVYKINGFSAGLTVSYTFTGANRRLAKQYQTQ